MVLLPQPMARQRITPDAERLRRIAESFDLAGRVTSIAPWGSGHIHRTYVGELDDREAGRFVLQRINTDIFESPQRLMSNLTRVIGHLKEKIAEEGGDPARETLTPLTAGDDVLFRDDDDGYWRAFEFIEGAGAIEVATDPALVEEIAAAFARFQRRMGGFPDPPLHPTIEHFADTRRRLEQFEQLLAADSCGRAASCADEISFVRAHGELTELLPVSIESGKVPVRIVHHDTKLNNVLIDDVTRRAVCVIDLDTVMNGSTAFDFGDCARLATTRAAEDETDLSLVKLDVELFEALVRGYLREGRSFLTDAEIDLLVPATSAVAFTMGLRFLTDYLAADRYFRIHREGHNLDRCRAQFALVADYADHEERMRRIVDTVRG